MSYSVDSVFKAIHSVADLGEGPGRPAPPPLILGQKVYILVKIKAKIFFGFTHSKKRPPSFKVWISHCHLQVT